MTNLFRVNDTDDRRSGAPTKLKAEVKTIVTQSYLPTYIESYRVPYIHTHIVEA